MFYWDIRIEAGKPSHYNIGLCLPSMKKWESNGGIVNSVISFEVIYGEL